MWACGREEVQVVWRGIRNPRVQIVARKSSSLINPQKGCSGVTWHECKAPSLRSKFSLILIDETVMCLRSGLNECNSFSLVSSLKSIMFSLRETFRCY